MNAPTSRLRDLRRQLPARPASQIVRASLAIGLLVLTPGAFARTITVNSTADTAADDGVCTLREAIAAANTNTASGAMTGECAAGEASPTVDTIAFAIPPFDGTVKTYQIVIPDFGTVEGALQIASLEFAGEHNGEVSYELSLESAGALTFTAASWRPSTGSRSRAAAPRCAGS